MTLDDIQSILISEERIQERVRALAAEIDEAFAGAEILAVGVLTGAFVFLADLVRHLKSPVRFAFLKADSYGDGTRPGELSLTVVGESGFSGRDVLLVEDILDTGNTLHGILELIQKEGPRSLKSVVLVDKPARREVEVTPDFTGFTVPDEFIVGYGLDHAQRYRNLPYIGVLRTGE
jgi:hypoxanthine phosphoribosyltransferase